MCGIAFIAAPVSPVDHAQWERYTQAVKDRGPDASGECTRQVDHDDGSKLELRFYGSVLHMRGDTVTPQPLIAPSGDALLWNGEIFDGLEVDEHENDGLKLLERIERLGPERFLEAIGPVEGPYAFVYFQASSNRLYFGRDPLGRRSLLYRAPNASQPLVLASNAPAGDSDSDGWQEVSCDALHCYDLNQWPSSVFPFDRLNARLPSIGDPVAMTRKLPPDPVAGPALLNAVEAFLAELERAIRSRVATVPRVPAPPAARIAVLFSGGVDCTVVAAILDRVLPPEEAIDLITVAFENPRSLNAREFAQQHPPKPSRRGIRGPRRQQPTPAPGADTEPDVTPETEQSAPVLGPYDVPDRLTARSAWRELVARSPARRWNLVEVDVPYQEMLEHRQRVIDLMKPQNTVMDLSIALAFYFAARGRGHLGGDEQAVTTEPYVSCARVLLSGLGADELLGGYARHRRAFHQAPEQRSHADSNGAAPRDPDPGPSPTENWQALIAELQMDLDRLSTRNLGRDDRIISIHGKEARYPFLAGHVVDFLSRLPVWHKADMRFVEGVGDKMLLRMLARELGLLEAAVRKKRAIHFGARTAKMDFGDGRAKGTDSL
ncbi:hypothetical protein JCM8202v2_004772 [Rhodotorula sphaerocarpa]